MKQKKVLMTICVALLCLSMLVGCGQDNRELFSINGEKITIGEFSFFLDNMKEMIAAESDLDIKDEHSWATVEIDNKKAIDVAKEKALEDVVSLVVQVQKAKQEGIELTNDDKKEIGKQKLSFIQQYGGEVAFNQMLDMWHISSDTFDKIMQYYKYASKLQTKYISDDEKINNITEEEIVAKYDTLKEQTLRDSIFVKHILIMPKPATDTTPAVTDEEAMQKAEAVLQRLNNGEDFDTVMREVTEDGEISYDGYSFTHNDGQMDSDFDNAAYALSVGEISGPVKTRFGYHIIKRLESKTDVNTLDEIRDELVLTIKKERYHTMVMTEWTTAASVIKQEGIFNSIK